MRIFDKICCTIFTMIIATITILLLIIGFGWLSAEIFSILVFKGLALGNGFLIINGIILLLAFKVLFFSSDFNEKYIDGILLENEDGKLMITKDTIKGIVIGVLKEHKDITDYNVSIEIDKENHVFAEVVIDVLKGTIIKDLSSKIQIESKKQIKNITDLEIDLVNVQIREITEKKEESEN